MILTKPDIVAAWDEGKIKIDPFASNKLNPNSYNLTLKPELSIYRAVVLDPKVEHPLQKFVIPEDGFILYPGTLYLGSTLEYTETHFPYVPMVEGRSSWGRLGLFVHVTAGFGDVGYCGTWTLELSVIHPLKIYPNMEICQIFYHIASSPTEPYNGKYQHADRTIPSRIRDEC